jgi:transcription initiation factor TFIIB
MYDIHLPTLIGSDNADANGKAIRGRHEFDQLRRLNSITISRDTETNNGMKAIAEINRITEAMALPISVSNEAQEVYRRGLKEGHIKGKSIVNMAAATILIASTSLGVSCSLDEMERVVTTVRGRMARKYYRLLIRTMNLEPARANPSLHVSRIAGRAGLSTTVQRRALEILEIVRESQALVDKRSLSVAGAALYLASIETGERINQLRLAYAVGTTPITIRKRSSDISAILGPAREAKALLDELREEERGLDTNAKAYASPLIAHVEALEIA